ncbi:MAG: glycoside hydrolase [Candidatus Coatesbacteria bacterium]
MHAVVVALWFLSGSAAGAPGNLLVNPSFEYGLTGWEPVWSRSIGAAKAEVVRKDAHDGRRALRVVHTGPDDWSVGQAARLPVTPGEIIEITGWIRMRGPGRVQLGVVLRDAGDETLDWVYGAAEVVPAADWQRLRSRCLIPPGGAGVQFRLTGDGPVDLLADGLSLVRSNRPPTVPQSSIELKAATLAVRIDGATGALTVTAGGTVWTQSAGDPAPLAVTGTERVSDTLARLTVLDPVSDLALTAEISLDPAEPEVTVTLAADPAAPLPRPVRYPYPFVSRAGDLAVLPYSEGLVVPVTATGKGWGFRCFEWKDGFGYSDWKTPLGFAAVTDLAGGYGLMLDTPWDAAIEVPVVAGRLALAPAWRATRGAFGAPRRVVYRFAATGGHVALAKRYRELVRAKGWLVPFAEKVKIRPAVAKLLGAVDLWFLDRELPADFFEDLVACGVDRALVSVGGGWQEPDDADAWVRTAEADGWLGSRYDLYTDVWNPADHPPAWLRTEGFPADVVVDGDGGYHKGWVDKSPGGPFQGYVLCAATHRKTAQARIAAELARTPYTARFIDVVCSAGPMECIAPAHPETRQQDAEARADMLKLVSDEFRLVTGSEEIREWAVTFSDFSEGTMTIRPAANAGYDWMGPVEPDADYAALNAGSAFRVPLFELVFHDCHVSTWYTGDGMTKVPACWDAKDLLNILYGTMPLWMPTKALWAEHRARFLASYHTVNTVFAAVGGSEMTSHEFLTPDRLVQRTRFASGHTVVANFGNADWTDSPSGRIIARDGFVATGPGLDAWRARVKGRVVTRVETPAKVYLDPGGAGWDTGALRCDAPAVVVQAGRGVRVILLGRATRVALAPGGPVTPDLVRHGTLYPLDASRARGRPAQPARTGGRAGFMPADGVTIYELE